MKHQIKSFLRILLVTGLLSFALCLPAFASGFDLGSLLGGVDAADLLEMLSGTSSGSSASSQTSGAGMDLLLGLLGVTNRAMKDCTVSAIKDQSYTGSAITPTPVVTYNGTRLKKGTDYTASYSNNTSVGTAKITLRGKGNYTGTKTVSFKIVRGTGTSSAASAGKNRHFTVRLTDTSYVYNGKNRKPSVKVTVSGKSVSKKYYTLTYKNNKSVGNATVTVRGKGDYKGYAGEASFKITLKKTSLTSAASTGEGLVACRWNADSQADGYQIAYATNKTFKNGKTLRLSGGTKKSTVIEKLSSGKRYYVRIRSYKKVGSSNWYSQWSTARSVKIK